jgi:hypothetical protein
MHGVPEDLDLSPFREAELERIDLGQFILHLRFAAESSPVISVEGHWELRAPDGSLLDCQMEPLEREAYRLHVLLGHMVIDTEVDAPDSFLLRFDTDHTLRIFDRSRQYESFSIEPGGVYV